MKILIDARFYGLENAGIGRYTINLLDSLAKIDNDSKYTILLGGKYFNRLNLPNNWKNIRTDFNHYSLIEQIRLPKIIEDASCDLAHFLHFNVPIFYRGKFVVTIHDTLMHKQKGLEATTLSPFTYYIKRLGYKKVFTHAIYKSSKIIVPSNFVKKDILSVYDINPEKIDVVYEGIDGFFFEEVKENGILKKYAISNPYFIYTGNAYPHKNLKRAIEATRFLNLNSKRKILFVVATSRNIFLDRLEKMIKSLDAERVVRILGFVSDSDLASLYRNSLGFIYPSFSEGFGLPGLEAMASGTLVLASDIPVFREIYKDASFYFNPYDFSSIEKVMEEVLTMDKEKREKLVSFSKEFAKRYSWSKMAEKTLKIYNSF